LTEATPPPTKTKRPSVDRVPRSGDPVTTGKKPSSASMPYGQVLPLVLG
jgi:hypothetical protein